MHQVLEIEKIYSQKLSIQPFLELIPSVTIKFLPFLMFFGIGNCTGISILIQRQFVSAETKRIKEKGFDGFNAKVGKINNDGFFFKLHVILSEKGEIGF